MYDISSTFFVLNPFVSISLNFVPLKRLLILVTWLVSNPSIWKLTKFSAFSNAPIIDTIFAVSFEYISTETNSGRFLNI